MSTPQEAGHNSPYVSDRRSASNPGKGVDYYAFLDQSFHSEVLFSQPINGGDDTQTYTLSASNVMQSGSLRITRSDVGLALSGRFAWSAYRKGQSSALASRFADIEPVFGIISDSNMDVMLDTPSVTQPDFAIAYGFYDSAAGAPRSTKQAQAYVYLTGSRAAWMGDLVNEMGSTLQHKPLHVWALPGAHDAGMFDTALLDALLTRSEFIGCLTRLFLVPIGVLQSLAPRALRQGIINMAFTQKDSIATMLDLGVRYFDFRPGHLVNSGLSPEVYHQRLVIPGYSYASFLRDVLYWLTGNGSEIVVVNLNFAGFSTTSMQPPPDALDSILAQALADNAPGQTIVAGDKNDLSVSYSELIESRKRLIFLNQVGASNDASKYDSYNPDLYATTDVDSILSALRAMNKAGQTGTTIQSFNCRERRPPSRRSAPTHSLPPAKLHRRCYPLKRCLTGPRTHG